MRVVALGDVGVVDDMMHIGDEAMFAAAVGAVAAADGVLIAGGGNLASTWPLHVYERAALAGIAARLSRPLVVSGQTLGPDLRGRDRDLVRGLLHSAALVGVRESASHAL